MIVYGLNQIKYVLGSMPKESAFDGTVYSVEGNPDQLVKVFQNKFRTEENENRILSAIRQQREIGGEVPVDAAYMQGAFVGFVYDRSALPVRKEPPTSVEPQPPVAKPDRGSITGASSALICITAGLVLSAAIYFLVFGWLAASAAEAVVRWNIRGIPMIVLGWVFMLTVYFRVRRKGSATTALALGILAYVIGAVVAFGIIWLLVTLIQVTASLLPAILPVVVMIAIAWYLLKKLRRRR